MVVTTSWYLTLAAILFSMGAVGLLTRRNPLIMIMCIELMLNAANLNFVAAAVHYGDVSGWVFTAIAIAIALVITRVYESIIITVRLAFIWNIVLVAIKTCAVCNIAHVANSIGVAICLVRIVEVAVVHIVENTIAVFIKRAFICN